MFKTASPLPTISLITDLILIFALNILQGNTTAEASIGSCSAHQAHPSRPPVRLQRVGAAHQRRDHGAPPQQAPPDLREQLERGRRATGRSPC